MNRRHILHISLVICFLFSVCHLQSQNDAEIQNSDFKNSYLLHNLFDKLDHLQKSKTGKVNIVHIGDSHIQADYFTDAIRQTLQARFGNGGYGLTFPYTLAKTSGTSKIKYSSNLEWQFKRNTEAISDIKIGISGSELHTKSDRFQLNVIASNKYKFKTIKILHPNLNAPFSVALPSDIVQMEVVNTPPKKQDTQIKHKVKSGESLYQLATKYKTSIEKIKKDNKLKNNRIKKGSHLIISPENDFAVPYQRTIAKETLASEDSANYSTYRSANLTDKIVILPNKINNIYSLSGIILENGNSGIIYHTIGAIGAKTSDFNKYPTFFEQLPTLNPDLIIISLGTNESFGKWTSERYMREMRLMINNIRKKVGADIPILLMTAPPSLFRKKQANTFVKEYAKSLSEVEDCVVWDLYTKLGGISALLKNDKSTLIAKDNIHYTKAGYELQGDIFSFDFLDAYSNYIKREKTR